MAEVIRGIAAYRGGGRGVHALPRLRQSSKEQTCKMRQSIPVCTSRHASERLKQCLLHTCTAQFE